MSATKENCQEATMQQFVSSCTDLDLLELSLLLDREMSARATAIANNHGKA